VISENPFTSTRELFAWVLKYTLQVKEKPSWSQNAGLATKIAELGQYIPQWFLGLDLFVFFISFYFILILFFEKDMVGWFAEKALELEKQVRSEELDPISCISKVKQPILFIHGTADNLIPYSHSEKL
jgi:hypothetical protein